MRATGAARIAVPEGYVPESMRTVASAGGPRTVTSWSRLRQLGCHLRRLEKIHGQLRSSLGYLGIVAQIDKARIHHWNRRKVNSRSGETCGSTDGSIVAVAELSSSGFKREDL